MKLKNYVAIGFAFLALSIYCLSYGPWQTWLGAFLFAWGDNIVQRAVDRRAKLGMLRQVSKR